MRRYTDTGRVVYDRKPHLFRWTDAARIAAKLEHISAVDILSDAKLRTDFVAMLKVWRIVVRHMGGFLLANPLDIKEILAPRKIFDFFSGGINQELRFWRIFRRVSQDDSW